MNRPFRFLLVALALMLSATASAADHFEQPAAPAITQILPIRLAQSVNHSVESVDLVGRYYHFVLNSDYGGYDVVSMALLRERVREIRIMSEALNQFTRDMPGDPEQVRAQFSISADSAVDILTRPVTTATDLAGQLASNINETLMGSPFARNEPRRIDYSGDVTLDAATQMHKRNVAFQWGLDPYTTNPQLQRFLNTVARARSGGRISAGAPPLISGENNASPIAEPDLEREVAQLIKSSDVTALRNANAAELAGMDVSAESRHAFLARQEYSPSRRTRIVRYLAALDGVRGRQDFVDAAAAARDETGAIAFEQAAMMLVRYHRHIAPIETLHAGRNVLQAVTAERHILFVAPVDLISWTESTGQTFDGLQQRAQTAGYAAWELLLAGDATALARAALNERGFVLREQFAGGEMESAGGAK